ncbi:Probable permease component of an ABC-transporter OS=Blastopirellula marina DSM 3645 GN=DSM3645_21212 PE=4 SV=1: ABC2_membrane_2: ABC2_membrane_2 [Gemmata massiliana]|uniref:ABC-2 type transporter domain-containing protein n=1 Tax=Gemmata massiliana TaxID=1210884 RepID=A0A6P2DD23_9BACT|nr:ABC transporter permease subunit [Gemmata massiliana]VTR98773.1 Probable permease component of an ABC-transporter OS=Blastopirellula marina DSM 3645 GN=DSM3645_21212 PE=4 SV=1: ABC2_membrane_2: ABC2_membrane_2 [Gemmata massiliana]
MNPIVRRELLDLLRARGTVVILVGCALVTGILVLTHWPAGGVGDLGGSAALGVLRALGYGLLTGLLLVLPAFPASAIVRERMRGTLALLLNSPMTPSAIYAGKLGGILGFTAILMLLTVPGAAASYALGGSTVTGGVGLLYAVLAALAVQIATIGLFVSGRAQGTDSALRTTYGVVLTLTILPLTAHWLLPRDNPVLAGLAAWLGCLSPVPAVLEVVGHGRVGLPGENYGGGAVTRYVCLALVMSGVLAAAAIRSLGRVPLDRARAAGVMTNDRSAGARAVRRVLFLVDPNRRSRGTSRLVNPVLVKELRTRRFGRAHWTLRLLAGTAVLSLALSYIAASGALGWGTDVIGGALVLMQSALLVLFVPSLSAGLISAEREGGTWQLLRTTPLSAGAILRGKLMSAVWPVLLLLCATMPGYVVLATVQPETASQIGRVLTCLGSMAVFAVMVGAVASSLFRSTAAATAASYLVLALVCIAPLLVWLGREAPFSHQAVQVVLMIDPVAAALSAANTPGFSRYDLLPFNWWAIGGTSLVLLLVLIVRTRRLYRPD